MEPAHYPRALRNSNHFVREWRFFSRLRGLEAVIHRQNALFFVEKLADFRCEYLRRERLREKRRFFIHQFGIVKRAVGIAEMNITLMPDT